MAALTEEQALLKEQAANWAREEAPVAKFREMRDSKNEYGFDKSTWASIAEMGWAGILVPEAYGGVEMGALTFGVVLEELGRQLTASPLLASGGVAASALVLAGSDAQKQAWLPRIAEGSVVVILEAAAQAATAPAEKPAATPAPAARPPASPPPAVNRGRSTIRPACCRYWRSARRASRSPRGWPDRAGGHRAPFRPARSGR